MVPLSRKAHIWNLITLSCNVKNSRYIECGLREKGGGLRACGIQYVSASKREAGGLCERLYVKCVRQSESDSVSSRACVSAVAEQYALQGKSEENALKRRDTATVVIEEWERGKDSC